MGAWGTGILEDDTAADFVDALQGVDRPFERMRAALEDAAAAEFLDHAAGHAALVSAAVVDAVLRASPLDGDEDLRSWILALDPAEARPLAARAVRACARLLAPGSGLNELWSENEEDYPRWRGQIEQLAARLSG